MVNMSLETRRIFTRHIRFKIFFLSTSLLTRNFFDCNKVTDPKNVPYQRKKLRFIRTNGILLFSTRVRSFTFAPLCFLAFYPNMKNCIYTHIQTMQIMNKPMLDTPVPRISFNTCAHIDFNVCRWIALWHLLRITCFGSPIHQLHTAWI